MKSRLCTLVAFLCCAAFAKADTVYNFNVIGSGIISSGNFTVTNVSGRYEITAITGTYADAVGTAFAGTITGLLPSTYSSSQPSFTSDGAFGYDNLFYPTAQQATCYGQTTTANFDVCGLAFYVNAPSSVHEVALYGHPNSGNTFLALDRIAEQGFNQGDAPVSISFTVAATPEPSTWLLTATGVIASCGALKRRIAG